MNPKVSIVIPAYNASNYLAEAIDSALAQTYKNTEIIVVNDGSRDDGATERVALSYGDQIRYFHKENGGSSSALNYGIAQMTGEWFSWLSHDDLYVPEKLEREIDCMAELAAAGLDVEKYLFFSANDLIDAEGKTIRRADLSKAQKTATYVNALPNNAPLIAEHVRYDFHGCSGLIHRSVLLDAGGFDEKLRLLNDIDLWFRLYAKGYTVHFIPEALVKGRVHKNQVSVSAGYSYHNPEQDMFWGRSLSWLKENHPDELDLFVRFGRCAYLKTRKADGDAAFAVATAIAPRKKGILFLKKCAYRAKAGLRSLAKKIYFKIKLQKR